MTPQRLQFLLLSTFALTFMSAAILHAAQAPITGGVTTGYTGGRFGDAIVTYAQAKWVSEKLGLPFYYKPLKFFEHLMVHDVEQHWTREIAKKAWSRKISIGNRSSTTLNFPNWDVKKHEGALYEVGFLALRPYHFVLFIDDIEFTNQLKTLMKPNRPIEKIAIPEGAISIAVHVRRGGGFDSKAIKKQFPLKFPQDTYYINQIKKLIDLFGDKPLYAHIFTDDQNPPAIMETYKAAFKDKNITWGCRTSDNRHDKNVIEDFCAMQNFDCLIASGSSFSRTAHAFGNHDIVIYPNNNNKVTIALRNTENVRNPEVIHALQEKLALTHSSTHNPLGEWDFFGKVD